MQCRDVICLVSFKGNNSIFRSSKKADIVRSREQSSGLKQAPNQIQFQKKWDYLCAYTFLSPMSKKIGTVNLSSLHPTHFYVLPNVLHIIIK